MRGVRAETARASVRPRVTVSSVTRHVIMHWNSSKSEAHGTLFLPLASAIVSRSIQITNNRELCLVLITRANESFAHMGKAWLVTPHPCSSVGVFPYDFLSASITSVDDSCDCWM